jgi:hypothetical protein
MLGCGWRIADPLRGELDESHYLRNIVLYRNSLPFTDTKKILRRKRSGGHQAKKKKGGGKKI